VVTSLLLLLHNLPAPWITLPVLAIVLREITVSSLREWLAGRNLRHLVKVSSVGKAKTAAQMTSLALLLLTLPLPVPTVSLQRARTAPSWLQSFLVFTQETSFDNAAVGLGQGAGRALFQAAISLFYFSTFLTVLSGGLYVHAAWPILTGYGTPRPPLQSPPLQSREGADPLISSKVEGN
jgi:phosphatidylglycerophosphate synthase